MTYDLKITSGTIVDGTATPGFLGGLGIKEGKVVSPGFVDVHTHYDAQILWDRMLTISPWHGVTTTVIGNCGFGVAPTKAIHRKLIMQTLEKVEGMSLEALQAGLGDDWSFETFPQYLDALEKRGSAINVAALFGHTPLRLSVMGDMKRGLMQITIGREFSTRHMAKVSRKYGVPVTWTALLSHLYGPGGHRKQLVLAAQQRRSGALVIPQVSCRPLNFEFTFAEPFIFDVMKFMNELTVEDARSPGARRRAYTDPAWREKLRSEVTPLFQRWWDRVVIAWAPSAKELEEQPLAEVARKLGKDPVDLALDLALASDLQARFRMAVMNFDEKEVAELITDPNTIIALSDAGAHASQLCDACYSTYLLGHWVRDKKTFTIEQAVHNLTQRPAEMFGITDRGLLAEGRPADVVVFDPKTVGPGPLKRVYDLPAGADRLVSEASGIDAVIVNGKLIRRDGKDTVAANDTLPGRLLRHGRAA